MFVSENVRLATVKFRYDLFGIQDVREITLRPGSNGLLSKTIKYAHEPGDYGYIYDISWVKRGGVRLSVEDQEGESTHIFADEIPD